MPTHGKSHEIQDGLDQGERNIGPKYKARLVVKGFKQEQGVNYDEIFSPAVKVTTLPLMLGVVATKDLELKQMDVKTPFLHGDPNEDIYMSQPAGFTTMGEDGHLVPRLKKSFYGLKQAPRIWYEKFDSHIRHLGLLIGRLMSVKSGD